MSPTANNLISLRQLLADRFPKSRLGLPVVAPAPTRLTTGTPPLDATLGGGLVPGEITELVGTGAGSGSCQVLHALLRHVAARGEFLALIDGADSFDATAVAPDVLAHLLWVRCRTVDEALGAADVLLRDPNLPLVVIDLKLNAPAQLRKAPAAAWHRFARLLEQNAVTVLVITPHAMVHGAGCRVECASHLGLDALHGDTAEVPPELRFTLLRSAAGRESTPAQAG